MGNWWSTNIVDAGKLPLLLCLIAFVVTFIVTRTITRMIRAGVGPFRDNVSDSGVHIHHAVPGLILLIVGAVTSIGTESSWWTIVAAVMIGIGLSLVLDEFALILHLEDVYWSQEGQLSVDVVALAAGLIGLGLTGSPRSGCRT